MTLRDLLHRLTGDPQPWFRRRHPFGYYPISRAGWIIAVVMIIFFFTFGTLFISLEHLSPILSWVCGAMAAAVGAGGHALIYWHMDEGQ